MTLKIAAWQALSTPRDIASNLHRLDKAAAEATAQKTDLLIAPEMFLTGYNIGDATKELAKHNPLEQARAVAARNNIAIVATGPEWDDEKCYNSAHLIDPKGEVLARYRKTHLFGNLDRAQFTAGNKLTVMAEYRGARIALLICYDVEFPETVRAAAQHGANLVCVPTCSMEPYEKIHHYIIPARAWENQLYVAYANQHGPDGVLNYLGQSVIAAPSCDLLMAPSEGEVLLYGEVSVATVQEAQKMNPYLADLRCDLITDSMHSASEPVERTT